MRFLMLAGVRLPRWEGHPEYSREAAGGPQDVPPASKRCAASCVAGALQHGQVKPRRHLKKRFCPLVPLERTGSRYPCQRQEAVRGRLEDCVTAHTLPALRVGSNYSPGSM